MGGADCHLLRTLILLLFLCWEFIYTEVCGKNLLIIVYLCDVQVFC